MPTDEQRMRERFEEWAEGIDMAPDFAAERERCPDDPTYGWGYGKLKAWEAWLARDAEVQTLRAALTKIAAAHNWCAHKEAWELQHELTSIAQAALRGEEGNNND